MRKKLVENASSAGRIPLVGSKEIDSFDPGASWVISDWKFDTVCRSSSPSSGVLTEIGRTDVDSETDDSSQWENCRDGNTVHAGAPMNGFTASTISFPLEVAINRLMVGSLQGKCPPHMAATLTEVIQEEGLRGLYRGWGASCLKVMPSSGITWMFYEAWKDILLVEKRPF
ncbi:hypothetical protein MRB53_022169 [Persea americana]|uniref:Uncharacterized protein n=1 Tax=Persea americana TaxID=3435 RepID=A0ACC2L613_PERAE|nr:hypothetical protein MRB53_022169 [Persea americana]